MLCIFAPNTSASMVGTFPGIHLQRRLFRRTTLNRCRYPSLMKRKTLRQTTATLGSNLVCSHSNPQPMSFAVDNVEDEREFESCRLQEKPHSVKRRLVMGFISALFCAQRNYGHVARAAVSKRVRLKDVENPKLQEALRAAVAGDLENSERIFTELIEEDPEDASVWSNRGSVRLSMDKFDEATNDFSQAIKLAPEASVPFLNRAIAYEALGHYKDAIEDCKSAIVNDPEEFAAWYNLGNVDVKVQDYDGALVAYERASALAPGIAGYRLKQALVLFQALQEGYQHQRGEMFSGGSQLSDWSFLVLYLLGVMLILFPFPVIILACSYLKESMRGPLSEGRERNTSQDVRNEDGVNQSMEDISKHSDEHYDMRVTVTMASDEMPTFLGLMRCGKSCRLRWINYLRPELKRGNFSEVEDEFIIKLHSIIGNKWSVIAARLPGRTENEIKNYWNSHIKRKLLSRGIDPRSHRLLCPPSNTTSLSRPAPDREFPVIQNLRTPEITDFFEHNRSESSPIVPAAPDAEEDPDLNLNLCISLPSNSSPAANTAQSVRKTVDSNLNSGSSEVCYPVGLQINYGKYCDSGYCEQNASCFSQFRLVL